MIANSAMTFVINPEFLFLVVCWLVGLSVVCLFGLFSCFVCLFDAKELIHDQKFFIV